MQRKYTSGIFFDHAKKSNTLITNLKTCGNKNDFPETATANNEITFPGTRAAFHSEIVELAPRIFQDNKISKAAKTKQVKKHVTLNNGVKIKTKKPCGRGLWYVSESAQLAGLLASLAGTLLLFAFFLQFTAAAVVTAAIISFIIACCAIPFAFRAISEGGLRSILSAMTSMAFALFVMAICIAILFFI